MNISQGHPRQSNITIQLVSSDQLALARVPRVEDLGGGRAAENAWVDEPGELDVWDVPAGAVDAFKVPDGFGTGGVLTACFKHEEVRGDIRRGVDLIQETTLKNNRQHPSRYTPNPNQIQPRRKEKPTPFRRSKIPVNPHGRSWNGCTSMISTSNTSPGLASSTSNGPER